MGVVGNGTSLGIVGQLLGFQPTKLLFVHEEWKKVQR